MVLHGADRDPAMTNPARNRPEFATFDEFLVWDATQAERHEYLDGTAVAMAGGSPRHNAIESNLGAVLKAALGRDCASYGSGQKIQTLDGARYRYADASAACGGRRFYKGTLLTPTLIIEVLSASTEAEDRGAKWDEYRRLPTLQDYLLISQRRFLIEHYQRTQDVWAFRTYEDNDSLITLRDGACLSCAAIYDGCWADPSDED